MMAESDIKQTQIDANTGKGDMGWEAFSSKTGKIYHLSNSNLTVLSLSPQVQGGKNGFDDCNPPKQEKLIAFQAQFWQFYHFVHRCKGISALRTASCPGTAEAGGYWALAPQIISKIY